MEPRCLCLPSIPLCKSSFLSHLRLNVSNLTSRDQPSYPPAMPRQVQNRQRPSKRYGAAELFGRSLIGISPKELRTLSSTENRNIACPFKPDHATCHKKRGVCSLAIYERGVDGNVAASNSPVTTCPSRFLEGSVVFRWVSKTLLETPEAKIVNEVSFLMSNQDQESEEDEVGRIDSVLARIIHD